MRQFDLSPLFRSSVGYDRLDEILETAFRNAQETSYPPYNIVKVADDRYRITLAVAGFAEADLDIGTCENVLTVRGRGGGDEPEVQYLHRGIARRAFEHRFQLADHVRVTGASLDQGLLDIELVRELPDAMKPQTIRIGTAARAAAVEGKVQDGR